MEKETAGLEGGNSINTKMMIILKPNPAEPEPKKQND
jgi:hypothetical protein